VYDLSKTSIIQNAWKSRKGPMLHGWAYDVRNGLINDLKVSVSDDSEMDEVYRIEPTDIL
jgi:carbonic anhydrase